jgi:glycosyltransferase involved in cell wall biosynthesis
MDVAHPNHAGVYKKLKAQKAALERALGPVDLWALGDTSILCNGKEILRSQTGKLSRAWLYGSRFYGEVSRRLGDADYIYIRYQRTTPAFIRLLHKIHRQRPGMRIFVELPTYPYESEQVSARDKVLGLIDRILRGQLKKYVHRIITFADEKTIFGIPAISTENGIDTSQIQNYSESPDVVQSKTVVLFSAANVAFYHGYDRIIRGLADYRQSQPNRRVIFHLAGGGGALNELKALTRQQGVEDLVHFHGPLHGEALSRLMMQADIGISSIGMHRLKVDTSNLKSREFCAKGLPFLIAYPDRDFPEEFPFCLHAAPDESAIDIEGLIDFYDRLRAEYPDYTRQLRKYAEERLTWDTKLAPVVAEAKEILGVAHDWPLKQHSQYPKNPITPAK